MSRKDIPKQARTPSRTKAASAVSAPARRRLTARSARLVGYARFASDEHTTALQLEALRRAGCDVIYEDSAARVSRPALGRAIADLRDGDTLVIWRLDRLGRSLRHLLEVAEGLRARNVALRTLTEQIDTGTAAGKKLYAVLGAVAEFEREVLRERTIAGMRAAKSRGEHIGRPPALTPAQVRAAKKMLRRGESPAHVARVLGVGRSTLYRHVAA